MGKLKNRKIFLLFIISCIAVMYTSCAPYNRSDMNTELSGKDDAYKIIYYASLAGSSHNTQPWKVEVYKKDSILIFTDMDRKLNIVDKNGRELFISLGAFTENLVEAAGYFGYSGEVKINNKANAAKEPIVTIALKRTNIIKYSIEDIANRRTIRSVFDTSAINQADVEQLIQSDLANIHFYSAASPEGRYIKQKTIASYSQQAINKDAQDELAKWIRFSNSDVEKHKDGLTTAGMEITGIGGLFVRSFYSPESSKKESFVNSGIERARAQAENCGGWILITQPGNDISDLINTGRLYDRTNIKCRRLNLGFHPMNQMIEEQPFEKDANTYLNLNGSIQFVARIGYIKNYPKPVSVRRDVESFTIFK